MFERLFASIAFKKRDEDRAKQFTGTEAEFELKGLVQIATDTEAKAWHDGLEECTSKVCHPQQLPEVNSDNQTTTALPGIVGDSGITPVPAAETITVTIDATSPISGLRNNFLLRMSDAMSTWLNSIVTNLTTVNTTIWGPGGQEGGDNDGGLVSNVTNLNTTVYGCPNPDPITGLCDPGDVPQGTLIVEKGGAEISGANPPEAVGVLNFISSYMVITYDGFPALGSHKALIDMTTLDTAITNIEGDITDLGDDITNLGDTINNFTNEGTLITSLGNADILAASETTKEINFVTGGSPLVDIDDDGNPTGNKINVSFTDLIAAVTGNGDAFANLQEVGGIGVQEIAQSFFIEWTTTDSTASMRIEGFDVQLAGAIGTGSPASGLSSMTYRRSGRFGFVHMELDFFITCRRIDNNALYSPFLGMVPLTSKLYMAFNQFPLAVQSSAIRSVANFSYAAQEGTGIGAGGFPPIFIGAVTQASSTAAAVVGRAGGTANFPFSGSYGGPAIGFNGHNEGADDIAKGSAINLRLSSTELTPQPIEAYKRVQIYGTFPVVFNI